MAQLSDLSNSRSNSADLTTERHRECQHRLHQLCSSYEKELQIKIQECESAKNSLLQKDEELRALKRRFDRYHEGLSDEGFLLKRSSVFKTISTGLQDADFLYQHSRPYRTLAESYDQVQKTIQPLQDLESHNKQLQAYIAGMRYGQGPHHAESFYCQSVGDLDHKIKDWARKVTIAQKEISPEAIREFLNALYEFGGQKTIHYQKHEHYLSKLFASRRARKVLYRHIIALYLQFRVLTSFAFGIDQQLADKLVDLETTILEQGMLFKMHWTHLAETEFGKVLTVRQALGTAALQPQESVEKGKQILFIELTNLFGILVSAGGEPFNSKDLTSIIDAAVHLRNEMTKEQAIYRFDWFSPDSKVDLDSEVCQFDYETTLESDVLALCTFPGLFRVIRNKQGNIEHVCTMTTKVSLE
jgi:hypothetical protein